MELSCCIGMYALVYVSARGKYYALCEKRNSTFSMSAFIGVVSFILERLKISNNLKKTLSCRHFQ